MNKKYIIGIVLVVLSIFAVVFFVGRDNNDATFKNGTEQNRDEAIGVENTENIETGQEQTTIPPTNPSPQIQQRAKDGALIIYYLDKGFTPNNLNAKRGETIRFINNSNNALRLASTEYSETENKSFAYFGQDKTSSKGDIYEYTFTETGFIIYKNLNKPEHTGAILIVQ